VIPPIHQTQFDPGVRIQAIPAELRLRRAVALHEAAQLAAEHGVQSTFEMLEGNPADEIVAYADSIEADLVVIGSRRRGVLASALLGSVSREVVRESRRPVLVVRGTSLRVDVLAGAPDRSDPAGEPGLMYGKPAPTPRDLRSELQQTPR
jgi:hypothetical protein